MKIQQVSNYTNQYTSNKAQQKYNSNPNFGMFHDVKSVRVSTWTKAKELLGRGLAFVNKTFVGIPLKHVPDKAFTAHGFSDAADVLAIRTHFEEITQNLSPEVRARLQATVEKNGRKYAATIEDGSPYSFKHFGQADASGKDPVVTGKSVITEAYSRYLEKMGSNLSAPRRASEVTATFQDVLA